MLKKLTIKCLRIVHVVIIINKLYKDFKIQGGNYEKRDKRSGI